MGFSTSCGSSEPPESSKLPGDTFGYGLPINPYELENVELGRALDLAEEAGANNISAGAVWWHIAPEPSPGSYNWEGLDRLVAETQRRGLQLNVQLSGTPDWVHPELANSVSGPRERHWHPPRDSTQLNYWSEFVYDVVYRYKGRIARYEIWNEPNIEEFWRPEPNPAEYAALLRTAYLNAKQAYPQAKVVSGGLASNDVGYLNAYYEAARRYPDAASNRYFFDLLGVHPYSSEAPHDGSGLRLPLSPDRVSQSALESNSNGLRDRTFTGLSRMKDAMNRQADNGKNIWIGEYGFPTRDSFMQAVPDYRRALYLKRAIILARDLPYVEGMSWYAYLPTTADVSKWAILGSDWNPSLTYRALEQITRSGEESAVTLHTPRRSISGIYSLDLELSGLSREDVSSWELYVDDIPFRTYERYPEEWNTHSVPNGGRHLMLAAYTEDGSVWPSNRISVEVGNVSVDSLGTDAESYAAEAPVEFRATLSAGTTTTIDRIIVAVRSTDTGENHDLPPVNGYTLEKTPETLSFEGRLHEPGTYLYWIAYYADGAWHDTTPRKQLTVE